METVDDTVQVLPLTSIRGIGPRKARTLNEAGVGSVQDLFNYFPRRYLDRRTITPVASLRKGEHATVVGTVENVVKQRGRYGRVRLVAELCDGTGSLELVWFRGTSYFAGSLREGDSLMVYGKVGYFRHQPQMQHPEFEHVDRAGYENPDRGIVPVYSSTDQMKRAGLGSNGMRKIIRQAFSDLSPVFSDNLSQKLISRYGLLSLSDAYRAVHFPSTPEMLDRAIYRFKWTELFFLQLMFALRRMSYRSEPAGLCAERSGEYTEALYRSLSFSMTEAQKQAVRDIYRDLRSGCRMNRLLQGDVGSGKTLVAMFAIALAADNGMQAVFMAPTEILAFQHYMVMRDFAEPLGLRTGFLGGRQQKRERLDTLGGLLNGSINIVVGTHAVLEESVRFNKLGLAVIDEQHRFGVLQRKALKDKAGNPHILLMTATPIPRTLSMGVLGDLDLSVIDQLPGGRKRVVTRCCSEQKKHEVYRFLGSEIARGRQAYIVYPLVEESEKMDLKAACDSFELLRDRVLPDVSMGLIHGQLSSQQKEQVMDLFRSGKLDLLVGTTVIEVGVDVPNATVMVVEHAERFGLAQLHQLRGRVGRGPHQSYCYLVHGKTSGDASARLSAMENNSDGFRLSEIDASIRGVGNLFGKEQSGVVSGLAFSDVIRDFDIMCSARRAAASLADRDPGLKEPAHRMIREHYMKQYHGRSRLAGIG